MLTGLFVLSLPWLYIALVAIFALAESRRLATMAKALLIWGLLTIPVSAVAAVIITGQIGSILTAIVSGIPATICALIVGAAIKIAYIPSSKPSHVSQRPDHQ